MIDLHVYIPPHLVDPTFHCISYQNFGAYDGSLNDGVCTLYKGCHALLLVRSSAVFSAEEQKTPVFARIWSVLFHVTRAEL